MTSLSKICEVFQEYYFARAVSLFNLHIAVPLSMDFTIALAENKTSYSYMYIEIIFEYIHQDYFLIMEELFLVVCSQQHWNRPIT